MEIKNIAIGCDHAGFPYKESIMRLLKKEGIEITDFGTDSFDSVDYPDYIHPVSENIEQGKSELGVIICGSGNGVAMTANKHQGIRAAICWKVELASFARKHNDANVIAIPARFVSKRMALAMVREFIHTDFEGGRHSLRVDKISSC